MTLLHVFPLQYVSCHLRRLSGPRAFQFFHPKNIRELRLPALTESSLTGLAGSSPLVPAAGPCASGPARRERGSSPLTAPPRSVVLLALPGIRGNSLDGMEIAGDVW